MDCEQAQRLISKSLDAVASPDERASLDAHCADCEACRAERERQLALHASLTASGAALLAALRPAVAAPVPTPPARRSVRRMRLRVASVAALMLLSAAVGYSLPRGRPDGGNAAGAAGNTNGLGERVVPLAEAVGPDAAAAAERPAVMIAELESRPVREVVWDSKNGLRASAVAESGRVCRVADPNGEFALEWVTTDRHYQLVGFPQE
jgi:predicted anti-sigma-YlaC factor YlaD